MPKYNQRTINKILNCPGAARELNICIQELYKSLDYDEKRDVDDLARIIQTNMKKIHGHKATKFRMGKVSYAELAIRLSILMIQLDCDAEGLRSWIRENK